jgi:hypothetical protein
MGQLLAPVPVAAPPPVPVAARPQRLQLRCLAGAAPTARADGAARRAARVASARARARTGSSVS